MLTEFYCPICGKLFIPAAQHIYKENGKVYCSWTCFCRRVVKEKIKKARGIEQYTKSGNIIKVFRDAVEAAELIGGTENGIRTACRKHIAYKGYLWRYKNDLP